MSWLSENELGQRDEVRGIAPSAPGSVEREEPEAPEPEIVPLEVPEPTEEGVSVELLDITDGDTIRVRMDGRRERVRLIGIDTPETEHSPRGPQPYASEATAALRSLLRGSIQLRFDAERRDRYGRLLAYVYVDDVFANAQMILLGWARPLTIAPNVRHSEHFSQLAEEARRGKRGIWRDL